MARKSYNYYVLFRIKDIHPNGMIEYNEINEKYLNNKFISVNYKNISKFKDLIEIYYK